MWFFFSLVHRRAGSSTWVYLFPLATKVHHFHCRRSQCDWEFFTHTKFPLVNSHSISVPIGCPITIYRYVPTGIPRYSIPAYTALLQSARKGRTLLQLQFLSRKLSGEQEIYRMWRLSVTRWLAHALYVTVRNRVRLRWYLPHNTHSYKPIQLIWQTRCQASEGGRTPGVQFPTTISYTCDSKNCKFFGGKSICDRLQRVYIYSDIRVPLVCFVIQIFHACSHVSNKTLVWYTRV